MSSTTLIRALLLAGCAGFSPTAMAASTATQAQGLSAEDAASLRAEIAALRAHVEALEARLGKAETASTEATASAQKATELASKAASAPVIKFKGAPEFSDEKKGWSFKPRGRMQWDVASVNAPDGVNDPKLGFSNKLRRLFLGFQGTVPGGFGYRLEADFANSTVTMTDVYLTYDKGPLNLTLGQIKALGSLDELTSDLDISILERPAFVQAFGLERRLGASMGYTVGDVIINAGVFTDNIKDLSGDGSNNSYSLDGRAIWAPKVGKAQLHAAASLHWRDLNSLSLTDSEYRARPGAGTTDTRFISSGKLKVSSEFGAGLELAGIAGPFHATAEAYWFRPELAATGQKAKFFGGYGEVGYFLTKGDSRPYKKGIFGAVKPAKGVDAGGIGAIQLVARYDYLEVNDSALGILGGTQKGYYAGVNWTPVEYVRFMLNYGHIDYSNVIAALADGTDRSYGVDTLGARAQLAF